MNVIEKVFGTHSERELKRIKATVDKIESLRPQMQALTDEELRGKTREYKNRLQEGETLDDLKPWMTFCRRHSPLSGKPQSVFWAWSITGCSSSAASYFTRAVSQR